jgi:hypothetical protein
VEGRGVIAIWIIDGVWGPKIKSCSQSVLLTDSDLCGDMVRCFVMMLYCCKVCSVEGSVTNGDVSYGQRTSTSTAYVVLLLIVLRLMTTVGFELGTY